MAKKKKKKDNKGIRGNNFVKPAYTKDKLTKAQVQEFIKCANDVEYFCANYIKVQHPIKGSILFEPYEYQQRIVTDLNEYRQNVILQPRQSGKSTVIISYLLWRATFYPNTLIGIAAHKGDGAKDLMVRLKFAYENLPWWIKCGCKSYNVFDVEFDNGSIIMSQTTSATSYRGKSITIMYLDEFAFVKPTVAEDFWTSILPSLATGGEIIITSTPNGSENMFADVWFGAEQGQNGFNAIRVYNEEVPDILDPTGFRGEVFEEDMKRT